MCSNVVNQILKLIKFAVTLPSLSTENFEMDPERPLKRAFARSSNLNPMNIACRNPKAQPCDTMRIFSSELEIICS